MRRVTPRVVSIGHTTTTTTGAVLLEGGMANGQLGLRAEGPFLSLDEGW